MVRRDRCRAECGDHVDRESLRHRQRGRSRVPAEIRQLAPEAFRALTYRAVRPEDYAEAAERLDWVQRAAARSAGPGPGRRHSSPRPAWQRAGLRRRTHGTSNASWTGSGRPAGNPRTRTALRRHRPAHRILRGHHRLPGRGEGASAGRLVRFFVAFFAPDNFTFGTPLDRSPSRRRSSRWPACVRLNTSRSAGAGIGLGRAARHLPAGPERGRPCRERPVASRPRVDRTHPGGWRMTSTDANCPCDVFVHPERCPSTPD